MEGDMIMARKKINTNPEGVTAAEAL